MSKLKVWNPHYSWEEAEKKWDQGAEQAAHQYPIKKLSRLPKIPGMTADTAKNLRWKSFRYMAAHDHDKEVWPYFWKHPVRYAFNYLRSLFKRKSHKREGDLFLYGVSSIAAYEKLLHDPQRLFVVGFSYCEKPFECPSGRFTPSCIRDPEHPVCRQCNVGKCLNALPDHNSVPLVIPTVHYIGGQIMKLKDEHPDKQLTFLITACEMTLEMFGDWGNMVQIQGIGVRLDGRICNTMRAFELSEKGIKPGLTVVTPPTHRRMLNLIRYRREKLAEKGFN